MNKNQFKVDGVLFNADDIDWEYSMQEGENAGRSDDGSMYHDEIGTITKVYYDFNDFRNEDDASALINLLGKTDCQLTYYDLKAQDFLTKSMYVSGDSISAHLINGKFYVDPFQLRFTSNKVS